MMSFPNYKLKLPWDHYVVGYMYNHVSAFVCVHHKHELYPYVTYIVDHWIDEKTCTHRVCHLGRYHRTLSEALDDLSDRCKESLDR